MLNISLTPYDNKDLPISDKSKSLSSNTGMQKMKSKGFVKQQNSMIYVINLCSSSLPRIIKFQVQFLQTLHAV